MSANRHYKIEETRGQKNIEKRKSTRVVQENICGKHCFLMPDASPKPLFPVCDLDCKPDCNKIHAAYVRAREWKYTHVSWMAAHLLHSYCAVDVKM